MFFDDLDPTMMLLTTVLFLILIWVLNNMLYKPMFNFMREREENIKEDEAKIQQNTSDANNNDTMVSKIYSDARMKAEEEKAIIINKTREECQKIIDDKKKAIQEEHANFLEELSKKREQFKNELRQELLTCNDSLRNLVNKI